MPDDDLFDEMYPLDPEWPFRQSRFAAAEREKQTPELQAHGRAYDDENIRFDAYEGELPWAPTIADLAYYRAQYEELHPYNWDNPYDLGENNGKKLSPDVKQIFNELEAQCAGDTEAIEWLHFTAYELSRLEHDRAYTLALKTRETIALYLAS